MDKREDPKWKKYKLYELLSFFKEFAACLPKEYHTFMDVKKGLNIESRPYFHPFLNTVFPFGIDQVSSMFGLPSSNDVKITISCEIAPGFLQKNHLTVNHLKKVAELTSVTSIITADHDISVITLHPKDGLKTMGCQMRKYLPGS